MKKKKQKQRPVISLQDVTKVYGLRHEKPTLVESLFQWQKREEFIALNEVSLDVFAGEKIGLVGKNGSGKTTLIKTIAGISTPTSGSLKVHGTVVSMIDVTAGFHMDLTGYDNLYLNGLVIGMTKAEIEAHRDAIISFADIGDFIYSPLHTYSEGMKLRLGIAIALHSHPDILLLDEVIVAGDVEFQKKSMKAVDDLVRSNTTLIMVSHWMDFLRNNCDRFIHLENGVIKKQGGVAVLDGYMEA